MSRIPAYAAKGTGAGRNPRSTSRVSRCSAVRASTSASRAASATTKPSAWWRGDIAFHRSQYPRLKPSGSRPAPSTALRSVAAEISAPLPRWGKHLRDSPFLWPRTAPPTARRTGRNLTATRPSWVDSASMPAPGGGGHAPATAHLTLVVPHDADIGCRGGRRALTASRSLRRGGHAGGLPRHPA